MKRRSGVRLLAAMMGLGLVLMVTALPSLAIDSAPTWDDRALIYEASSPAYLNGSDRYLAYDHYGKPGAVTSTPDTPYRALYLRSVTGGTFWHIVSSQSAAEPAVSLSMVYNRREQPLFAYAAGNELHVQYWDGASWINRTVSTDCGSHASLAVDLYGRPAVVFNRAGTPRLNYICDTDNDGNWDDESIKTIHIGNDAYYYPKLGFDAANNPFVVYATEDGGSSVLCVSAYDTGSWATETLRSANSPAGGFVPSLAMDPTTGLPAVVTADSLGHVIFLHYADGQWSETDMALGIDPSVAFDPADGNPVVAYGLPGGGVDLQFWDGDSWELSHVEADTAYGRNVSLAFNPYGNEPLAVAYYDLAGQALYWREDPPVPEPATLALLAGGLVVLGLRRVRRKR